MSFKMDFGKCIFHLFNPNSSEYISYFSLAVRNYQDQKQLTEEFILPYSSRRLRVSGEAWHQAVGMEGKQKAECSHPHPKQEAERGK